MAGSSTFMNVAVWESVEAFKGAFGDPTFQEGFARYPDSTVASPHLFSWSRVPIWRSMELAPFADDFSATIHRTDKVQPALLVVAILSAIAYAVTADGSATALAWVGTGGLIVTLAASVAVLVPLQRRIIAQAPARPSAVEEMRRRWFRGHLGRSVLSMSSFVALALAATV